MYASFRIRLLMVIVLASVLGLIMQSNSPSKQVVEPVIKYIMKSDNNFNQVFNNLISQPGNNEIDKLPASVQTLLKAPCNYVSVEHNYGSYWSETLKREEFNPGMTFKVNDNTRVIAVLPGIVESIQKKGTDYTVRIRHAANLESVYGGLQKISVSTKHPVIMDQVIGNTGEHFYFELRNKNDPVNPQSIFK
jgi:murein DD-endopeptidase MepM/ murein hydrolase activator NlpD